MQNKTSFHGILDWKKTDLDSPWLHEAILYMPLAFSVAHQRWTYAEQVQGRGSQLQCSPCPDSLQAVLSSSCSFFFFLILFIYLHFWLRWVFVAARGLSLVAASGGFFPVAVRGLLRAQTWGRVGSTVVMLGLCCFEACGIFQDQGWTCISCIDWQVDS